MPMVRAFADVGEGVRLLEAMRLEEARDSLAALHAVGVPGEPNWWYPLPWLILARLGLGEAEAEAIRLDERLGARRVDPLLGPTREYIDQLRALLWLAAGRIADPDRLITAHAASREFAVAEALRALVTGDAACALRRVLRYEERGELRPRLDAMMLVVGAAAAVESGHTTAARRMLGRLVSFDAGFGARTPWLLLGDRHRRALRDFAAEVGDWKADDLIETVIEAVPAVMPSTSVPLALSTVESEVLRELFRGGSIAGIAARRFVSENTVKSQLRAIYRKLGASGRGEAVQRGMERGLL